jgi:hypothetical protein
MIKLRQIKKIGSPPDWQFTMPNHDVIDIRVERRGANYRRYHIILPAPHGKMVFERMADLRDFLNQNYAG